METSGQPFFFFFSIHSAYFFPIFFFKENVVCAGFGLRGDC